MGTRQYLCIDPKSFYATVECVARGLDPMTTDLVVADPERSENTICLAVSPSLKAKGVSNRCRIMEIPKYLKYIVATPRMQLYIDCAAEIYGVFLKYIAPEDIHVYSIDESFLDVTPYLKLYNKTARELAKTIIDDVKEMMDQLCLDMVAKKLSTQSISMYIGYSHTHCIGGDKGTAKLATETNADSIIIPAIVTLYKRIVNPAYPIRRVCLCCNNVVEDRGVYQLNMFDDVTSQPRNRALQETMLDIRAKYGKNAILKGMNYDPAATGRERNMQIGGHKSNG